MGGLTYISVCSGIEAATVAWDPLGFVPVVFAEIEKFPSAALKHHYPNVPNAGDFTKIKGDEHGAVDVLVAGTPCQDFSVAGLRAGMDGQRGQLTVEFARLAGRLRPRWLVWENVPGVLSIDGGRAFGMFLGLLGKLGYGLAYRVLDAQHFGVPQRRRRVFVVGHLGDWRRAAAVLFERQSLSGYPAPRREERQGSTYDVAPCVAASGRGFERPGDSRGQDCLVAFGGNNTSGPIDIATAVNACGTASGRMDFESETFIAHALRADGFDASEDGLAYTLEARSVPRAVAFDCKSSGRNGFGIGDVSPTLRAMGHADTHQNAGGQVAVVFDTTQITSKDNRCNPQAGDPCHPLAAEAHPPAVAFQEAQTGVREYETSGSLRANGPGHDPVGTRLRTGTAVRRLTPRECERLQGFPDDYTKISAKTADGPRYKALGNAMPVPVMRWIGERIATVDKL